MLPYFSFFFFSSRRRHTRLSGDWSSDVCSSDLDRRVRPRLGLRHGTPLASRDVPGERGRLSSSIWNLGFFSERCTEKLPLRVDFIHRLEFGEVSGHRVLIKRGPGNRGPTECGTT